jgi:oxygen-independent coproporphyrinogen-3 oxidase
MKYLLEKYNIPGPRYTSYPTVPAWSESVGPAGYGQSLALLKASEPLSLYFHLPFCERLCHFCGCMQVITKDHSRSRPYVNTVLKEMEQVRTFLPHSPGEVQQIHFGGGTPNFLQPEEMSDLMTAIRRHFTVHPDAEIAIEMHPRTSTRPFCDALKQLGFNRISLGVQDFDPWVQKLIHRDQSYEQTAEVVAYLRSLGFETFNFDLIYGLPGQTMGGWEDTLQKVWGLHPNRLAVYSYAHVPWVRPVQRSFQDKDLPLPELKIRLFERAYLFFREHGYHPIGMDHFALSEDDLGKASKEGGLHRNFMGYSTRADAHQIGFGVSAISFVGGNYFQNVKELPAYEGRIANGELATFRGYLLNQEDALRRELIMEIMCHGRVKIPHFERRWGIDFAEKFSEELSRLQPLMDDNLVTLEPDRLETVGFGHLFLRNIAMAFDPYLAKIRDRATHPIFSKTI